MRGSAELPPRTEFVDKTSRQRAQVGIHIHTHTDTDTDTDADTATDTDTDTHACASSVVQCYPNTVSLACCLVALVHAHTIAMHANTFGHVLKDRRNGYGGLGRLRRPVHIIVCCSPLS